MTNSDEPLSPKYAATMYFLAWIFGLAILGFALHQWLDKKNHPNQNEQSRVNARGMKELKLAPNTQGHYLAKGTINGYKVNFLVDTGATYIGIPGSLEKKLKVKIRNATSSHTAGGIVNSFVTRLDQVSVGGITQKNVTASIIPDMPGTDVLLGMSFLSSLEIIQRDNVLILREY